MVVKEWRGYGSIAGKEAMGEQRSACNGRVCRGVVGREVTDEWVGEFSKEVGVCVKEC